MSDFVSALRRASNRWLGSAPWRIAPFVEIAAKRNDAAVVGEHRPEAFAGTLAEERDDGAVYRPTTALLGQVDGGEPTSNQARYLPGGIAPPVPKRLYTLTDAGVAGRDGVVYCPQMRAAVAETVRCWVSPALHHPLLGAPRFPAARRLPGLSLCIATLDAEGFYHFLLESLPRLWLARAHLGAVDHVLVSGPSLESVAPWLELAGVARPKIVVLHGLSHFRCDQLLFADLPMRDSEPTPWLRTALAGVLGLAPSGAGRRALWISRSGARSRHLTWEDALLARLPQFEKIVLESLSPAGQIALASEAAIMAGPHGAGLAQLALAPAGIRLVELFPPGRASPAFSRLAQIGDGRSSWASVDFSRPDDLDRLAVSIHAFLGDCQPPGAALL